MHLGVLPGGLVRAARASGGDQARAQAEGAGPEAAPAPLACRPPRGGRQGAPVSRGDQVRDSVFHVSIVRLVTRFCKQSVFLKAIGSFLVADTLHKV